MDLSGKSGMAGPDWREVARQNAMQLSEAERNKREMQELVIENWNARVAAGGPVRPSPSVALLRANGYRWIQVRCPSCETSAWIDVDTIDAFPGAQIADLTPRMKCVPCNRQARPPTLQAVLRHRPTRMSLTG